MCTRMWGDIEIEIGIRLGLGIGLGIGIGVVEGIGVGIGIERATLLVVRPSRRRPYGRAPKTPSLSSTERVIT